MSGTTEVPEDDCLAVWCAGDDWCALTCTMEVIGNKWHPVIVQRLLENGPLRFNDLSGAVGPITNKVLSNSLKDLGEKGLVNRTIINEQPVEVEYELTGRGESLEPVIQALQEWGTSNLKPAASEAESAC